MQVIYSNIVLLLMYNLGNILRFQQMTKILFSRMTKFLQSWMLRKSW